MKPIIILTALFFSNVFAQATLEDHLREPFDNTVASLKEKHPDKKIEQKEVMTYTALMYYDWVEPISIRVGYLFGKDGKQTGKVIGNGKDNEEDAQKLFNSSKAALIKKYGGDYVENSMMGLTMITWNHITGYSVMLTRKGGRTSLTVFRK